MRILIVRHGQTDMNVAGVLAGHLPAVLTDDGLDQARLLGLRLQSEIIDVIYSSDLIRARQTTEAINKHLNQEVNHDTRLRERTWGVMDSSPVREYREMLRASGLPYHQFKSPGGESIEDLLIRAKLFIAEELSKYTSETILISSHHSMNKALIFCLLNLDWDAWTGIHQENTCLNELTRLDVDSAWKPVRLNCTAHLR